MTNKNIQKLLGALIILRTALKTYDTDLAHNILIDGGSDMSEEEKEEDLEKYIAELNHLINLVRILAPQK